MPFFPSSHWEQLSFLPLKLNFKSLVSVQQRCPRYPLYPLRLSFLWYPQTCLQNHTWITHPSYQNYSESSHRWRYGANGKRNHTTNPILACLIILTQWLYIIPFMYLFYNSCSLTLYGFILYIFTSSICLFTHPSPKFYHVYFHFVCPSNYSLFATIYLHSI